MTLQKETRFVRNSINIFSISILCTISAAAAYFDIEIFKDILNPKNPEVPLDVMNFCFLFGIAYLAGLSAKSLICFSLKIDYYIYSCEQVMNALFTLESEGPQYEYYINYQIWLRTELPKIVNYDKLTRKEVFERYMSTHDFTPSELIKYYKY